MSHGRGTVLPPPAIIDFDQAAGTDGRRPYRVVFVCSGNICRSPMAEVITRELANGAALGDGSSPHGATRGADSPGGGGTLGDHIDVRSAGTGPWHEGEDMHPLATSALLRAGYPGNRHVARQFRSADIGRVDLMVALDRRHQQTLRGLGAEPGRIALLRSFDPRSGAAADVPDPYYGDDAVFDECRDMIAAACQGLVASLAEHWEGLWAP